MGIEGECVDQRDSRFLDVEGLTLLRCRPEDSRFLDVDKCFIEYIITCVYIHPSFIFIVFNVKQHLIKYLLD